MLSGGGNCYVLLMLIFTIMKVTTYVFGNFADGYSQYPDNYTRDIFKALSKSRKGATELIYHRDGALTYYIYTREISRSANTFIGLCYVFNDVLVTDFSYLFDIFEDAITNIVVKGELLEFTNDGNLSTKISQLYTNAEELQRISDFLNSKLSSIGRFAEKLPPINHAISNIEWQNFAFDEISNVKKVVKDYSNIRIIKGENYDTNALKGYAHKLRAQNEEIKTLTNEIFKLRNEISKLKRQKKQFTAVVILIVIIAIGLLIFISSINSRNEIIKRKNIKIEAIEKHNKALQADSINLSKSLTDVNDSLQSAKSTLKQLGNDYSRLQSKNSELQELSDTQKKQISKLQNKNNELERSIADVRNKNNESERIITDLRNKNNELESVVANLNSSYSSYSYSVGPSTSHSITSHDAKYALWLYASKALKINYFYVHPDKSGTITIGLYNAKGSLVASCRSYVSENKWIKINPNFELKANTKYYLAIKDANGISLAYHNDAKNEYSRYQSGYLQLLGYGTKGESSYRTSYYQYFYDIHYSLKK